MKLFGEIKPDDSKFTVHGRGLEFELVKADDKSPFWKKLLSGDVKPHWLKIDFNKWKDEDDSEDEGGMGMGGPGGPGGFPGAPGGSMGGFEEIMKQMGGFDQGEKNYISIIHNFFLKLLGSNLEAIFLISTFIILSVYFR